MNRISQIHLPESAGLCDRESSHLFGKLYMQLIGDHELFCLSNKRRWSCRIFLETWRKRFVHNYGSVNWKWNQQSGPI